MPCLFRWLPPLLLVIAEQAPKPPDTCEAGAAQPESGR